MPLPPLANSTVPATPVPETSRWERSHLAVPRENRAILAIPDRHEAVTAARINSEQLSRCDVAVQGRPLSRLRHDARTEAIQLAEQFTADVLGDDKLRAPRSTAPDTSWQTTSADALVVVGHQPALYHPGVWAKNFAAGKMAESLDGNVLNLVVDNDILPGCAVDVPSGTQLKPQRRSIPFDQRHPSRPWEGATVRDGSLFHGFGRRISEAMSDWNVAPLIGEHWRWATDRFAAERSLPECLTAMRHGIEADWGHHQFELPMSWLCQTDPFLWVASSLLANLPRFNTIHNNVLGEYRSLYRIKSRNHPVPELETRGDWTEAPFWVWRAEAPNRRRVFAKTSGKHTVLADDAGETFATLPLNERMDACCAVEVLRDLPQQGICFRTRALTTTLFARMFLADTFVHGIGGAKYDEMTDRIISQFWGISAPAYATISASLYLPFAQPFDVTSADERRLREYLRGLAETPERHLTQGINPTIDRLLTRKAELVAEQHQADAKRGLSRSQRRAAASVNAQRFHRLREVTSCLATEADALRIDAENELKSIQQMRRANTLLTGREFSLVLYPETEIRPFMESILSR